jgi:hypothetical protein
VTSVDTSLLEFVRVHVLGAVHAKFAKSLASLELTRSHVTFLKYDAGGKFDWHHDFEKVIVENDSMQEMHLLLCVSCVCHACVMCVCVFGAKRHYCLFFTYTYACVCVMCVSCVRHGCVSGSHSFNRNASFEFQ